MAFAKTPVLMLLNQNGIMRIHDKTPAEIHGIVTTGIETCLIFVLTDKKAKTSMAHVMVNCSNMDAIVEEVKWLGTSDFSFEIYGRDRFYETNKKLAEKVAQLVHEKLVPKLVAVGIHTFGYKTYLISEDSLCIKRIGAPAGKLPIAGPEYMPCYQYNKAVNDLNVYFSPNSTMGLEFDGESSLPVPLDPAAKVICDKAAEAATGKSTRKEKGQAIAEWIKANLDKYDNQCFKTLKRRYKEAGADGVTAMIAGIAFVDPDQYIINLTTTILNYLEVKDAMPVKAVTPVLAIMAAAGAAAGAGKEATLK